MIHIEIYIREKLDPSWSSWFEGFEIRPTEPEGTLLDGKLPDKAAVYGILSRLSSLCILFAKVICEEISDEDQEREL